MANIPRAIVLVFDCTAELKVVGTTEAKTGTVDLDCVGKLGHSFGGAVTVRATRKDKRIKCGVNMDERLCPEDIGKLFDTPFLFLLAEKSHQWVNKKNIDAVFGLAEADSTNMYTVIFTNVAHGIFSDAPFHYGATLFTRFIALLIESHLGVSAEKAKGVLVKMIIPYILDFFNKHLKNRQSKFFPNQSGEIVVDAQVCK